MQNSQDKILIGEAYYFDTIGKQIVAKGFGQFDTANYHLKAELSTTWFLPSIALLYWHIFWRINTTFYLIN